MSAATLVRQIAARRSIVFDAFMTAEGLTSWWGPDDFPVISASVDVRVGGHFRVRFRRANGLEPECCGEFLEVVKPERLVMSWQWLEDGEPEQGAAISRVEFHLRAIDTGTELTLVHAELRNEISVRNHTWGWDGALKKLIRHFADSHAT